VHAINLSKETVFFQRFFSSIPTIVHSATFPLLVLLLRIHSEVSKACSRECFRFLSNGAYGSGVTRSNGSGVEVGAVIQTRALGTA